MNEAKTGAGDRSSTTVGFSMVGNEQTDPNDDREALVSRLREMGLRFLTPSDADPKSMSDLPVSELITQIAGHPDYARAGAGVGEALRYYENNGKYQI